MLLCNSAFLQGVQEAASSLLGKEEFLKKILALAAREDRVSKV